MTYNVPVILDFLKELKYNNSVEWMHAHQKEYQFARDEFNRMADYIIQQLALSDPAFQGQSAKTLGFRLARDTRFSKNKLPYHTHFGFYHTGLGRKVCAAGYFLYFQPDDEDGDYSPVSMIDAGLHKPSCAIQKVIREAIYHDENHTLQKMLDSRKFKQSGFEFYEQDMFKRPQKQYADYEYPQIAPLLVAGVSSFRTFIISVAIGLLEIVGVLLGFAIGTASEAFLPVMLGFAGGTMLYVTNDEMIPETHAHGYQKQATYALLIGFMTLLLLEKIL